MTLPRSYSTDYADHRRASRVGVPRGKLGAVVPLVPVGRTQPPPDPGTCLVGPEVSVCMLGYEDRVVVLGPEGMTTRYTEDGRRIPAFDTDGVRVGNQVWTRDGSCGELQPLGVFDGPGRQLVARRRRGWWATVLVSREPLAARLLKVRVRASDSTSEDDAPCWAYTVEGDGTAAIADDDTIAVAGTDRVFRTLRAPASEASDTLAVVGERELVDEPYQVSALHEGFVLVCADDSAVPAEARVGRLHGRGARRFPAAWTSEICALDGRAQVRWTARVGFPVLQPAVELDGERVLVVGRGVACLEAGRLLWSRSADEDVHATAFCDGTVALGFGSRVAILDRDGTVLDLIGLPDGASVVCPPAIASDGSLVIATTLRPFKVPVL